MNLDELEASLYQSRQSDPLDQLVASYLTWLEVKAPEHLKSFKTRLNEDPEAAHAEAVTFGVLRTAGMRPKIGEVVGKGGVDFIAEPSDRPPFAVEVTTIRIETVTKASGLKHPLSEGFGGFNQITGSLLREAVNKATQVANQQMPRVLVIATEHDGASLLMGTHSAEELLTGTTAFQIKIGDVEATPEVIAPLKNSVFFRMTKDQTGVEPARQSISAILLMTISRDGASILGILHPQPAVPFDPKMLDQIHFIRLRSWPIAGNRFGIEWVGPPPSPTRYLHFPIELINVDLKVKE
jgi:hypothetical protein